MLIKAVRQRRPELLALLLNGHVDTNVRPAIDKAETGGTALLAHGPASKV
jgi:hypothetical protein